MSATNEQSRPPISGAAAPNGPSAGTQTVSAGGTGGAAPVSVGDAGGTQVNNDGGAASTPPRANGNPPCEVAAVLTRHCAQCHSAMLREGAPIVLVDAEDFQRDLGGQTAGAAVLRRMRDDARPMPPPPAARVSVAEIDALARWVSSGAQPAEPGCAVDAPPSATPRDPSGGVVVTRRDAGAASDPELDAGSDTLDASVELPDAAVPIDAGVGPEPAPVASAWPMFGADLSNSRNSAAETAISPDDVGNLRELWRFNGPSTSSAPAVRDDTVYLPGWDGRVYALRLEDGSRVWTAELPDLIDSSPAVTETHVFVSDDNGSVHALDRATGAVRWSRLVDDHEEAHLWSSPVYIPSAGLIVSGVASGEEQVPKAVYTFRGSVVGLDAETGDLRWRFETAAAEAGSGPGVGSWATAAVDESRRLVFIGTGNNYQTPYSEYSDSMLAIDYDSGELRWSRQFTDNDAYTIYGGFGPDYDIGASANLFSIDGKDFVGIGVKSGHYFALDRETGEIVWRTTISSGSVLGGVISAPAYANGLIFVASNEFVLSSTTAAAIDARNGEILWSAQFGNLTYGGVAHANGVVFIGSTAGSIYAFDAIRGDVLWVDQTPGARPIAGSPTVANGRLLVPWGYQWTLREGNAGSGGLTVYGL